MFVNSVIFVNCLSKFYRLGPEGSLYYVEMWDRNNSMGIHGAAHSFIVNVAIAMSIKWVYNGEVHNGDLHINNKCITFSLLYMLYDSNDYLE